MNHVKRKIRWGIVGLGKVAHRFANDLTRNVNNAKLYAAASNDSHRATIFGTEFECDKIYDSYEDLAKDPNVDIVYIASINLFHRKIVELFLNHEKHVFVEKPAFTNVADWDQMASLATRKNLLLVEAMKTVVFPAYQTLRRFIQEQSIVIESLEASFGNQLEYSSNKALFNPRLKGGSTLDAGVYLIWLYIDLCNATQTDIPSPSVQFYPESDCAKIDENVEFNFRGTINAKLKASITQNLSREAMIRGPQLEIVIKDKWWNPKNIDIKYKGETYSISISGSGGGFEYEIEHISSLIQKGIYCSDILPASVSRKAIAIMERCLSVGGFGHLAFGQQPSD